MKIITLLVIGVSSAALLGCKPSEILVEYQISSESSSSQIADVRPTADVPKNVNAEPPVSAKMNVPFAPQAPFADWGDPYQEACEEMSLIMVHHYLQGTSLSLEKADAELLELVDWMTERKYAEDVTTQELADIAGEYYGYTTTVSEDVSIESIQSYVQKGRPVILPVAGRMLHNPYFSGEGPFYHMLVVTGYDSKHFITNDPGTKRGEGYRYDYETLLNAVHDWTGVKEETHLGKKVMLVVER